MPPTYTHAPISSFYAAYWAWFHAQYRIAPLQLYGGAGNGPTTHQSWGGWQRNATGVWAGVAFSGNMHGGQRVVKVELYSSQAGTHAWGNVLAAVQAGTPAASHLWTGLQQHVHRHAQATEIAGGPGVYSIRTAARVLGHAATAVPAPHNGAVPQGNQFGLRPTAAVPSAVSIERGGLAGRVCAFHEDVFDLTDAADVQRMADWMHTSLLVYRDALAQILP